MQLVQSFLSVVKEFRVHPEIKKMHEQLMIEAGYEARTVRKHAVTMSGAVGGFNTKEFYTPEGEKVASEIVSDSWKKAKAKVLN